MNKKFINEFVAGEAYLTALLVSNVTRGVTSNGAPYLSITFTDKTGTIEGKLWDVKEDQDKVCTIGKVVNVNFDVINYKNNVQIKVHSIYPLEENEYDLTDYVISSEVPQNELRKQIDDAIKSIKNTNILMIVQAIMADNEDKFFLHPAASKIHHNYVGGLAEHTCGMLKHAMAICDVYPSLNRDLLIGGVMIHDIGKIRELSDGLATEYTTEGKLLGHISIMQAYIYEISKRLNLEDSEESMLLRHMVLAHHGEYDFGSPVLPLIAEAEALASIDKLDATMNILSKAYSETNKGEFTQKLFALEQRCFYKPKI